MQVILFVSARTKCVHLELGKVRLPHVFRPIYSWVVKEQERCENFRAI